MDNNFNVDLTNVFTLPDSVNFCYKNNSSLQTLDYNNLTGFDNGSYTVNGDLFSNSQQMFLYQQDGANTMNYMNFGMNETISSGFNTTPGLNNSINSGMNGTLVDDSDKCFDSFYNTAYYAPGSYNADNQSEVTQLNLGDLRSIDQFCNYQQSMNQQVNAKNMAETSLIEPGISIGEVNSEKSSNSQNYSFQSNYQFEPYNAYQYYGYAPLVQDANVPVANGSYVTDVNDSNYVSVKLENLSNKESLKDDLESVANASTCDNTPIMKPSTPNYMNTLSPNYGQNVNAFNSTMNGVMSNGYSDMSSTLNGINSGLNVEAYAQDLSNTQLVNGGAFFNPSYYQYYYTPTMSGYNTDNGYDGALENAGFDEGMNESIIEIANEIANNVQYLPDKDSNGKYSLDKNHPIHCVWRDVNRGHCSWRCRWWENGKRLSKNFNVKRFGDFEAMRMAITMKIRNSTPVERIQLLKEQREAVRNQMQLYSYYPSNYNFNYLTNVSDVKITKVMNSSKKLQRENWNRLSWTYLKMNKTDKATDSTIICRLCSKTTRCSRSRNLQQAHIMHLIRMHKNPWKQYIDPNGLTKMCKLALDALYDQNQFRDDQEWNLRPGIQRPEPYFTN